MQPEPSDLPQRVTHLEQQYSQLAARIDKTENDAAAARLLASTADRDIATITARLTANTTILNTLRDDFTDLRGEMNQRFAQVHEKVDQGFIEMLGKFDAMATGQHQIVDLLTQHRIDPNGNGNGSKE